jgi:hypothetical protein
VHALLAAGDGVASYGRIPQIGLGQIEEPEAAVG